MGLIIQAGGAVDTNQISSPMNQKAASKLIEEIKNQYAQTKNGLEALGKPYDPDIAKELVTELVKFYHEVLTTNSKALNAMNITVMLHHFATIAKATALENWVIETHEDFVQALTKEVISLLQWFPRCAK